MERNRVALAIWEDIRLRRNLDVYVAILLSLSIGVAGLIGVVSLEVVAAAILMVLGVLLWTAIRNRHDFGEITAAVRQVSLARRILRFANYPDPTLREHIRAAKDIRLSGLNFHRFFPLYLNDLEHALGQGAALRVIITDPNSPAMEMASFSSEKVINVETERNRVNATIDLLRNLRRRLPQAHLVLRGCGYLAPYAIVVARAADPGRNHYHHARILPFRSSSMTAPEIAPSQEDRDWIEFIEKQFEALWDASTEVTLDSPKPDADKPVV